MRLHKVYYSVFALKDGTVLFSRPTRRTHGTEQGAAARKEPMMRLTPNQIKQGVLHPEQEVRDAAVYYFAGSSSTDPTIMPLVVQAIEEHGWDSAFGMYSFLERLFQTEDTLIWTIEQLRRRGQPDDEDEASLTLWLLDTLINAAPDLLKAHEEEIRELDAVDEESQEAIEEKTFLHGFTAEKLWRELEEFCEQNKSENYLTDEDVDFAHRLVEALGRHPAVFDAKVLEILSREIDDYTDNPMLWMEPCIVRLAGELRLQQAIPLIIRRLHEDDDVLDPGCMRSLTKIGTDEVVNALAADFPRAEWGFRWAAAQILETIHSDRSVEQCLTLLDSEEDLEIKCRLAQSAVMNFADEAIEPARQLILDNDLDPDVIEVRSALLAASMLIGVAFPEFDQWREDAKNDVEFRKKWYAEHERLNLDDEDGGYWDEDGEYWDEDDYDVPFVPPDTVVRETRKIGRNDPCPCGSGKKYKKCCVRKGNGETVFE